MVFFLHAVFQKKYQNSPNELMLDWVKWVLLNPEQAQLTTRPSFMAIKEAAFTTCQSVQVTTL